MLIYLPQDSSRRALPDPQEYEPPELTKAGTFWPVPYQLASRPLPTSITSVDSFGVSRLLTVH